MWRSVRWTQPTPHWGASRAVVNAPRGATLGLVLPPPSRRTTVRALGLAGRTRLGRRRLLVLLRRFRGLRRSRLVGRRLHGRRLLGRQRGRVAARLRRRLLVRS